MASSTSFVLFICAAFVYTHAVQASAQGCAAKNLLQGDEVTIGNKQSKPTALNIFPISVEKNLFLKGKEDAKPVWGQCLGTTNLGEIGDIEYLVTEGEWIYYFDCNNQKKGEKNLLCKRGSQKCFATECVIELKGTKMCMWIEGEDGAFRYGINENSCFEEYQPKTEETIDAQLSLRNDKNADSQLTVCANTIKEVHKLTHECQLDVDSLGPSAYNTSSHCVSRQDAARTMVECMKMLHGELQKEKPEKQANMVANEQNKMDKLKEQQEAFQREIVRKNKIAESAKKTAEKRKLKVQALKEQREAMEKAESKADEAERGIALKEKKAQEDAAKSQREKHRLIHEALAKELQAKELESLGRKAEEATAKRDLAAMMKKSDRLAANAAASEQKAKEAIAEKKQLEAKHKEMHKQEKVIEKQRLKELEAFKEAQKVSLKQELELRQRKREMEDNLRDLQGDVATLEGKLLASGKTPSKHSLYDVSDIDAKYQEQAKKRMESMIHGYGNVLTSQVPAQQQQQQIAQAAAPPALPKQQNINIVIGCGKNCNKKEEKEPAKVRVNKVDVAVKAAIKKVMADRAAEDADQLERRRLELEHDQRVQEQASLDVKKALDEKRDAEDRVTLLKARLNQQKSDIKGVQSELSREKAISQVDRQREKEKEEKIRAISDATTN